MMIHVCPLNQVDPLVKKYQIQHIVTLVSHEHDFPVIDGVPPSQHLKLCFNDVEENYAPELTAPSCEHIEELISFISRWDQTLPLLIHCWAGISRSTAAAFITLCTRNPQTDEITLARALRAASPVAAPNKRMISYGDAILKRAGRMISAINATGASQPASIGFPFQIPTLFPPDRSASP